MTKAFSARTIPADLTAGMVVFLVALPLCLGIALASAGKDYLFAGIISGIVGGLIVGAISKSHTSVAGPAAGLTTVVAAQLAALGKFEVLLLAIFLAGIIQIGLGILRAGFIAAFCPSSVLKGLLASIGIILILKQLPHFFGHDSGAEGEFSFFQVDHENTFSELLKIIPDFHPGATVIGAVSLVIMAAWEYIKVLKKSIIPGPLVVVVVAVIMQQMLEGASTMWKVGPEHLVPVPVAESWSEFSTFLKHPDFSYLFHGATLGAAVLIALVASLETLLNIEAVDKIDPQQRTTPPNRELIAQGVGNIVCGLIGGLPVTSVIVRSSVNINAGGKTRLATIVHGSLLLGCVIMLPKLLNLIPLSSLAAILIVTGLKLASPSLIKRIWDQGWYQFLPFAATVLAIVFTDLLIGVLIGLGISIAFILHSNFRRPMRRVLEKHPSGEVLRIELANQVTFLNRANVNEILEGVRNGGHVLLDARYTDYIDPDVVEMIHDFKEHTAPKRDVHVSLLGFKDRYHFHDHIEYVEYIDRELQSKMTPQQVIRILQDGNARFRAGQHLTRDTNRQIWGTANGQFPLAVVLSCIDSRAPAELIFDAGLGDIFSTRVAGNITTSRVLGSIEYGCAVAGSKLVLVMGHTRCGAVMAAIDLLRQGKTARETTGCENLDAVVAEIQKSIDPASLKEYPDWNENEKAAFVNDIVRQNVLRTIDVLRTESPTLDRLDQEGKIKIVGGVYVVTSGEMMFMDRRGQLRLDSVAEPAAVV